MGRPFALKKENKMKNTRTPATPNESRSKAIKNLHKRSGKKTSLKAFVRASQDKETQQFGAEWFHNKTANFSKLPLGIGSTRKKNKNKNKQAKPAVTSV